jgi:4-hydroxy-tetrahydrodipicolinate reductase
MSKPIRVIVTGINGRMGRACVRLLDANLDLALVGAVGRAGADYVGKDCGELGGNLLKTGVVVSNGLNDLPEGVEADVLLDFTHSGPAVEHVKWALGKGIRPVTGSSGIDLQDVKALTEIAARKRLGAMVVPNFSVGAVLMMEFARLAGAFFPNVEIVEMHHTRKLDAPSGTAMFTAKKLSETGNKFNPREVDDHEILEGSRGGSAESGVRIHSLRLPGLISHQEVIFGAQGELLTIRHDSFNTDCFVKGIEMALKAVIKLDHLVVGLDSILSLNAPARAQEVTAK